MDAANSGTASTNGGGPADTKQIAEFAIKLGYYVLAAAMVVFVAMLLLATHS
jgi:hypothetical protein